MTIKSLLKGKSSFNLPRNRNKELETQINFLNNLEIENKNISHKRNLSTREWMEPKNPINHPDILIKQAHRRRTVRVLSKTHYKSMIHEHLANQNMYQKLNKNIDPIFVKNLNKLANKYSNSFTNAKLKYFKDSNTPI